ncbi:uncharacterized protein [Dermacentor albipictus]|uniref:uncharacterized protein n=1 Tax=Dermacentor albipictus TaxID=60249 RepID=UPI0038FC48E5
MTADTRNAGVRKRGSSSERITEKRRRKLAGHGSTGTASTIDGVGSVLATTGRVERPRYTRRVTGTTEYAALCTFTYCLPVGACGVAVLIIYVFIEETGIFTPFRERTIITHEPLTEVSPCLEPPHWAPCLPPSAQARNASLFYFDRQLQACAVKEQLPIPCLHQTAVVFTTERECVTTCANRTRGAVAPRECRRLRLAPCTASDIVSTYIPAGPTGCQQTQQCHGSEFVFHTLAECQSVCFGNMSRKCGSPAPSVHCSNWSRTVRWFYNAYTLVCQEFHQLCLSGRNRFATYDQCLRVCVTS